PPILHSLPTRRSSDLRVFIAARQKRNDDEVSSRTRSAATTLSHIKRRPIGKVGLYFTFHQQLTRFLIGPTWPPCKGVSGRPRTSDRKSTRLNSSHVAI